MALKKQKQKKPTSAEKKLTIAARAEKKAAKRAIKKELAHFAPVEPKKQKTKHDISPLAEFIVKVADMKKAMDIVHLCVKGDSSITDDVIIITGSSTPHLKALAGHIERDVLEGLNVKLRAIDGRADTGWLLLDFYDAIVHIFTDEVRKFYDLERHYANAPTMDTLAKIQAQMIKASAPTKRVTLETLTASKRVSAKKTIVKSPAKTKTKEADQMTKTKVTKKVATPKVETPVKKVATKTVAKKAVAKPAVKKVEAVKTTVATKTTVKKVATPKVETPVKKVATKTVAKKAVAKPAVKKVEAVKTTVAPKAPVKKVATPKVETPVKKAATKVVEKATATKAPVAKKAAVKPVAKKATATKKTKA